MEGHYIDEGFASIHIYLVSRALVSQRITDNFENRAN